MRKVKLEIEEKLIYRRDIYVQVPDGMSEDELERILAKAQREGDLGDFMYILDGNGIEAPDGYDDSLDCPNYSEVECDEYDFVDDEAESA